MSVEIPFYLSLVNLVILLVILTGIFTGYVTVKNYEDIFRETPVKPLKNKDKLIFRSRNEAQKKKEILDSFPSEDKL
mgnify:CR=1 FL=1